MHARIITTDPSIELAIFASIPYSIFLPYLTSVSLFTSVKQYTKVSITVIMISAKKLINKSITSILDTVAIRNILYGILVNAFVIRNTNTFLLMSGYLNAISIRNSITRVKIKQIIIVIILLKVKKLDQSICFRH